AVSAMQTMRREEGRAMRQELTALCGQARECVDAVESHRPAIVAAHRDRLHHRVSSLLADLGVTLSPADLLREAAILADRSDVAEEITRLRSHCAQFEELIADAPTPGRTLDFLAQEMHRESNTIGAKANSAEIAQRVVELKTIVERIRELVQNVE
ncbi:MAG: endoribonuclease YicC domain-containing protein, partial [Planctomycetia bacterium]